VKNITHRQAILRSISFLLLASSVLAGELREPSGNRELFFFADRFFQPQNQVSLAAILNLPPLPSSEKVHPAVPALQLASAIPLPATGPAWQSFERNAQKQSEEPGFNWGGALKQSGLLLGIQHSLRMLQEKTRNRLDGKWWQDYLTSIEGLQGWNDGNPIITNYVGHPIMGAITGYIQIQNDPQGILLEWAPHDANYWKSRMKAIFWAALYSTQYELGPLGEAMIGNVGFDRGTMGYVDLVVTPTGGLGMILLEDWLDKRVVAKLELGKSERQARFLRVVLNPQRSIANLLRFKRPSHRDTRPLALP
jgi:hypothetical protein